MLLTKRYSTSNIYNTSGRSAKKLALYDSGTGIVAKLQNRTLSSGKEPKINKWLERFTGYGWEAEGRRG
jgi:hypothetical protein